jgi:GTP cyclohydrolase I
VNRERMVAGVRELLAGLLEGVAAEERAAVESLVRRTPERVASAFADDLLSGYGAEPAAALEPVPIEGAHGPVVLTGVRFESMCAHHLLPYAGEAHVAFEPGGSHVGLGGIARLVDALGRRLTLQETLTARIADTLVDALAPSAVVVALEAEHQCLAARGARKTGHRFRTLEARGARPERLEALLLAAIGP